MPNPTAPGRSGAQSTAPDVTRERLLAALDDIKASDGGGIRAPTNPGTGQSPGCFAIVTVRDRQWVRQHPAKGFECGLGESFRFGWVW